MSEEIEILGDAMTRHDASALFEIWKSGLSLSDALAQFDPQPDKSSMAKWKNQIHATTAIGKRNWSAVGVDGDAAMEFLENTQLQLATAAESHASQERQLIAALENAELVAIGYQSAKGSAAKPELVPPFLFQRQFAKFKTSEFSDGECRFAKVRISPVVALKKSKIGRPSIREQVFEIAKSIESHIVGLKPGEQAAEVHRNGMVQFPEKSTKHSPTNRAIDRHLKSYWKQQ